MAAHDVPRLAARYYDGRSARAQAVTLQLEQDALHIHGDGIDRRVPLRDLTWPERTRHGVRVAHLQDGGSVQCDDAPAWDAWSQAGGRSDGWVVRAQQSWRWVLASVLVLVVAGVVLQQWGLPLAARAVVAAAPLSLDKSIGDATLSLVDEHMMRPSKVQPAVQERVRAALSQAVKAAQASGRAMPEWQLVFRDSRIGPNALALPGGTLVLTDQLVELVGQDTDVITAVLAHELGHVQHRHGLRMLVQVGLLGTLSALVLGDFSTVLAGAPVLVGQASYSRDAEREADAEAVRTLRAAGISPVVMVTLFDKLEGARQKALEDAEKNKKNGKTEAATRESLLGIAFASHPTDADRVRFFKDAAAGL